MRYTTIASWLGFGLITVQGQVLWKGNSITENFNSLAAAGTENAWQDNNTLTGWYASAASGFGDNYRASDGATTAGDLYSFGSTGDSERSLGSVSSGTPGNFAFGMRLKNNSGILLQNIQVAYTGEQWRVAGTTAQTLAFSYRLGTSVESPDVGNQESWIPVTGLDFTSPVLGSTAGALDGNASGNRTAFTSLLTGASLQPNEELFLRWTDINDAGNDHALGVDDVTISAVPEPIHLLGVGLLACLFHKRKERSNCPKSS